MRSIQGLQNVLLGLGSCATVTYQGAANDRPCRNEPSTFVLGYQHQQLEHREWLLPNLCRQLICRHRAQEHHPCAAPTAVISDARVAAEQLAELLASNRLLQVTPQPARRRWEQGRVGNKMRLPRAIFS
jgi:hypothetical protein